MLPTLRAATPTTRGLGPPRVAGADLVRARVGQSALTAPGGGAKAAASLKIHSRKAFTFGADAVRRGRTNQ